MDSFWPSWAGETCFLLGGGPSLRGFDCERLRGNRVIVTNNAYLLCPWADLLFFCDARWWKWHEKHVSAFLGRIVTTAQILQPGVRHIFTVGRYGLDERPDRLRGNNSGYQAINLAYHHRVKRIVLLGYDMQVSGTETHWHEGHPDNNTPEKMQQKYRDVMIPPFETLVDPLKNAGIEVLNANQESALPFWPRVRIEEILRD